MSSFSTDGKNFYLASLNGNSALEFSSDGKFVKAIGTKGRGPGEHMGINKIFPTQDEGIGIMTLNKINNRWGGGYVNSSILQRFKEGGQ